MPDQPLHPKFPVVDGLYQMSPEWAIRLPRPMNRRIEDGSLVLWRPGLTAWIILWGNDEHQPAAERLASVKDEMSHVAFEVAEHIAEPAATLSYRLREQHDRGPVEALYSFTFNASGHVQLAVYFDKPDDLADALALHRGVTPTPPGTRIAHP